MKWVARVFTIYVLCDPFDQPSPPVTPTDDCLFCCGLTARLRQRRVVWRIIEEHPSSSTHPKCADSVRCGGVVDSKVHRSSNALLACSNNCTSCLSIIQWRINLDWGPWTRKVWEPLPSALLKRGSRGNTPGNFFEILHCCTWVVQHFEAINERNL